MLNSRDISLLRPDVAANCRKLIELSAKVGYPVLVTGTVRDEEYQRQCVRNGTASARATMPTFHGVKAGLAFDICKNVRGQEYNDADFWAGVGAIGKRIGFTWGGEWKSFRDQPHFQWDSHKTWTGAMLLAGKYPPEMPLYRGEEEETLTDAQFRVLMDHWLNARSEQEPNTWSAKERKVVEQAGLLSGDEKKRMRYQDFVTRETLAVVLAHLLKRDA